MHYNENAHKGTEVDEQGNIKYAIIFPKAKKGAFSLQARKKRPTYGKYMYLRSWNL